MGEKQKEPFQLSSNNSLKVDFQGLRVTSDGGLILVRELDERLGFGELIDRPLVDRRHAKSTQFALADLLRQSVCSRSAGSAGPRAWEFGSGLRSLPLSGRLAMSPPPLRYGIRGYLSSGPAIWPEMSRYADRRPLR